MRTENDVLNMIADIQSLNDRLEEAETREQKAKFELENAEDDLECLKSDLASAREKLDEIIDELTGRDDLNEIKPYAY